MDLEYRLDGPVNAPVLVLSNSLGTNWTMWDAQYCSLIKNFRVLRYNTRGHGGTPLSQATLSLASLGEDVIALLDHLNIEKAHFCGISLGGMTGMWLNRHYPQRFDRFVVANTAAKIGSADGWLSRAENVRSQGMELVALGSAQRWFTEEYLATRPGIVDTLIDNLEELDPVGYARCCEILADADLRDDVPAMTRPMLVIAGEFDPVTTEEDAAWIAGLAVDARYSVLPASHLSNVACPAEFSQQTIHFLTAGAGHGLND